MQIISPEPDDTRPLGWEENDSKPSHSRCYFMPRPSQQDDNSEGEESRSNDDSTGMCHTSGGWIGCYTQPVRMENMSTTSWRLHDLREAGEPDFEEARQKADEDKLELQEKSHKAITMFQHLKDNEGSWRALASGLKCLEKAWRNITVDRFVMNVTVLGPSVRAYLDFLSIELDTCEFWRSRQQKFMFSIARDRRDIIPARFPGDDDELKHLIEPVGRCCHGLEFITRSRAMHSYVNCVTHWTTVENLISPKGISDKIFMVKALQSSSSDNFDCFSSVVPRCIIDQCWNDCKWEHVRGLLFDVLFLSVLGFNTGWIMYNDEHPAPPKLAIVGIALLAVRAFLAPVWVCFMTFWKFGLKMGLVELLHLCTDFCSFVRDWAGLAIAFSLSTYLRNHDFRTDVKCKFDSAASAGLLNSTHGKCALIAHPVVHSSAIALAWCHLTLELMCFDKLGKTILPAFYALFSVEMLKFVGFLCLLIAGSFQAYWSLPIPQNQPSSFPKTKNPWFSALQYTFMKIFQLDMLGDFDVLDLEGVDPEIDLENGQINEGQESPLYHDGVTAICILSTSLITVAAINLSIGVLGKAYEENKIRATSLYYHYLSGHVYKLLLEKPLKNWLRSWLWSCFDDQQLGEDVHGYFIRCNKLNRFDEPFTQKDFRHEMKKFEEKLESVLTELKQVSGFHSHQQAPASTSGHPMHH